MDGQEGEPAPCAPLSGLCLSLFSFIHAFTHLGHNLRQQENQNGRRNEADQAARERRDEDGQENVGHGVGDQQRAHQPVALLPDGEEGA